MFTSPILEMNRQLAEQINAEVRANPEHPYKGKFVGIANGKVVGVAGSLKEIGNLLRAAEPDNTRTYVLEAGADYSEVEYIWEMN